MKSSGIGFVMWKEESGGSDIGVRWMCLRHACRREHKITKARCSVEGLRARALGITLEALGFRLSVLGFGLWASDIMTSGSGLRVQGSVGFLCVGYSKTHTKSGQWPGKRKGGSNIAHALVATLFGRDEQRERRLLDHVRNRELRRYLDRVRSWWRGFWFGVSGFGCRVRNLDRMSSEGRERRRKRERRRRVT